MSEGPEFKPKEDFPNNSEAARTPVPRVELRKPWWKAAFGWLISGSLSDVSKNVIQPALQDMVINTFTRIVRGTGNPPSSGYSGGFNTPYNTYSNGWTYSNAQAQQHNYSRGYSSGLNDYMDITLSTREEAEWLVSKLRSCAQANGIVTISDLWQILNIKRDNPMETKWGWTINDVMKMDYTTGFGRWRLVMPPAKDFE